MVKVALAFSFDGSTPGRLARSANQIARSVPAIRTVPSLISRSAALVSRASAAISRRLAHSGRVGRNLTKIGAECEGGPLDAVAAGRNRRRAAGAKAGGDPAGGALEDVHAL